MCRKFGDEPADAWEAQIFFRSLLPVLSRDEAAVLFDDLNYKINSDDNPSEAELIAKLLITTAYVRYLIASREREDRVGSLIDNSQSTLDALNNVVNRDDDDIGIITTRPALELELARLEEEASLATDVQFFDLFPRDTKDHPIWKEASKNDDLVIQADYLHIPHSGIRGIQLDRLSDGGLPQVLLDSMGDLVGYINAMTDRILSVSKLAAMPNLPPLGPRQRTISKLYSRIIYDFMSKITKDSSIAASGIKKFEESLYSCDVPFVRFKGSFARLQVDGTGAAKDELLKVKDDVPRALHWMAENGYIQGVILLLENGADVNTKDSDDQTSLFVSVKNGNVEIVKLLLEKGADAQASDGNSQTPLSISVANGDLEIVRVLCKWITGIKEENRRRLKIISRTSSREIQELINQLLSY